MAPPDGRFHVTFPLLANPIWCAPCSTIWALGDFNIAFRHRWRTGADDPRIARHHDAFELGDPRLGMAVVISAAAADPLVILLIASSPKGGADLIIARHRLNHWAAETGAVVFASCC
jgi:hypothetical protein